MNAGENWLRAAIAEACRLDASGDEWAPTIEHLFIRGGRWWVRLSDRTEHEVAKLLAVRGVSVKPDP